MLVVVIGRGISLLVMEYLADTDRLRRVVVLWRRRANGRIMVWGKIVWRRLAILVVLLLSIGHTLYEINDRKKCGWLGLKDRKAQDLARVGICEKSGRV